MYLIKDSSSITPPRAALIIPEPCFIKDGSSSDANTMLHIVTASKVSRHDVQRVKYKYGNRDALCKAANADALEDVKILVQGVEDINAKATSCWSPLLYASVA